MNTLAKAKELLAKRNAECVVLSDSAVLISYERGVSPIVKWLKKDRRLLNGSSVAHKEIDQSEAYLLTFAGVRQVYSPVMSTAAEEILQKNGVGYEFGKRVNHVPVSGGISAAFNNVSSPEEAYARLVEMDGI